MGRLTNWAISTARHWYYSITEPVKLKILRGLNKRFYESWGYDETPLVSVYVPTHNRAELLVERSLRSIRAQTYANLEIIVAAHGCTDDTVKRVTALGDSRIRVIEVPRRRTYPPTIENHWFAGPVAAANAAMKECKGDWIARNDDDDEWTPDHIEKLLKFAQRHDLEFVSGGHSEQVGDVGRPVMPYIVRGVQIGGTQTWLYRAYLKHFKYNPDCWRKRRDRVNDTDLQRRFLNAGVRMGYLSIHLASVISRPGETTVGLKAYKADEPNKLEQLAFN